MNLRIVGAILRKDLRSLYPIVLLSALVFAGDVVITRLDLISFWGPLRAPVLLLAGTVLVLAIFQSDTAASLVDDWLCRPVPRAELLTAKLILLFAVVYASRAVATLVIEPVRGAPLAQTLQAAFLLEDPLALFLLPVLLLIAMVTRSILQGCGVLLGILIAVFVIPTPLVSAPGALQPAIGEALFGVGLGWLAMTPATLAGIALAALGCWLVYWRRRVRAARGLLAATVALALLLALLPMWLAPWEPVLAAQTSLAPVPPQARAVSVYLHHPRACFPATRMRDLPTDSAFDAAREAFNVHPWTHEDLRDPGPDSVAFLTSVEPRQLPPDWRVRLMYAQANYSAGGSRLYSLRPAHYDTGNAAGRLPHAWVLPQEAVRRLTAAPQVELELQYSLALLQPHPFSLPLDERYHAVPGLGHCSARLATSGSQIDVDCFLAFNRPAQISAELPDIPASRVYAPPDFSPGWTRRVFGPRFKLSVGSPRFSNRDHITVTAWSVAGYLEESLVLPGLLGNELGTCPLPSEQRRFQAALWRDSAPHEVTSVGVDEGVQLEVLDFGGTGDPVLLLPGLGATAHSFDELAPELARRHRVFAITRRGFGISSKPDFGYDTPRLARDVLRVMDALELPKVLLVGHSIAGEELTWLGGHHPDRFRGLVYLDAAYDRSEGSSGNVRLRELSAGLPPEPPIPPEALLDYAAMSKLLEERGHTRLPEGELIAFLNIDEPFLAGTPDIDMRVPQAILAALQAPDYARVRIPALAIYAIADPARPLPPWYDAGDELLIDRLEDIGAIQRTTQRANIERFRKGVAHGEIIELPNATHYLTQSNPREVLEAIEAFCARTGAH